MAMGIQRIRVRAELPKMAIGANIESALNPIAHVNAATFTNIRGSQFCKGFWNLAIQASRNLSLSQAFRNVIPIPNKNPIPTACQSRVSMPMIGPADNGPMNAITYANPLIGHGRS